MCIRRLLLQVFAQGFQLILCSLTRRADGVEALRVWGADGFGLGQRLRRRLRGWRHPTREALPKPGWQKEWGCGMIQLRPVAAGRHNMR